MNLIIKRKIVVIGLIGGIVYIVYAVKNRV